MRATPFALFALLSSLVVGCPSQSGFLVVGSDLQGALLSVRGTADDDVWACGSDGGDGPGLVHWNGSAWERFDTSAWAGVDLWWLYPGDQVVTVVGSGGTILELDRATGDLRDAGGPGGAGTFFGVWGDSGDDLWAVGGTVTETVPPLLWRNQGDGWADARGELGAAGDTFFKIHGNADGAVIVGTGGLALRKVGGDWVETSTGVTERLLTVDVGPEETVAVGGTSNGLVLHLDGEIWTNESPEFQLPINGVCSGGGVIKAVGGRDALHTWTDGAWTTPDPGELPTSLGLDYHACWLGPDGTFWSVGGDLVQLTQGFMVREGPGEVDPL